MAEKIKTWYQFKTFLHKYASATSASWLDKDGNPSQLYDIQYNASPFWIKVFRREDSQVVFDTSAGPILYYNQFLQLTTFRPTNYMWVNYRNWFHLVYDMHHFWLILKFSYGFGETEHTSFKYNTAWTTQGMWARDNGVGPGSNLYGVQPYHIAMENRNDCDSLLLSLNLYSHYLLDHGLSTIFFCLTAELKIQILSKHP